MKLKRYIILFIVLLSSYHAKSQLFSSLTSDGFGIETDIGYGFVMPHHKSIEYTLEDHIRTFDIKITKPTYGKNYWNQLYRYPYYGLGYYRSNLGNNEVFGYANALYTYVKVPVLGQSNKANVSWQFAFGASYITETFDISENPQNLAIGSKFNIFLDFSLQSRIPLSKRLSLINSVRFTHMSNGKITSPNKGLNILSGSVGLFYELNLPPEANQVELPDINKKNEYTLIYAGGIKTKSRYQPGYYYASSLIFDFNRNYSLKGRWNIGTDIFFDGTNRQFSDHNDKADIINTDLYQVGLHAGHDIVLGNISMVINVGGYIYAPVEVLAPIYSRIGLRYRFNNFVINYTLKSHWAKASFIEWGIGYVF